MSHEYKTPDQRFNIKYADEEYQHAIARSQDYLEEAITALEDQIKSAEHLVRSSGFHSDASDLLNELKSELSRVLAKMEPAISEITVLWSDHKKAGSL